MERGALVSWSYTHSGLMLLLPPAASRPGVLEIGPCQSQVRGGGEEGAGETGPAS